MESVSWFKMNSVTENYWFIYMYAAVMVIITFTCGVLFSITELIYTVKLALQFHVPLIVT